MFKGITTLSAFVAITAAGAGQANAQVEVRTHNGGVANDLFGTAVSAGGDINNDGAPDYLIGAAEDGAVFQEREGFLRVYNGATGALIRTHDGQNLYDRFGTAAARVGDTNPGTDSNDDYVVGAHYYSSGSSYLRGKVYLYSGANGALRWSVTGGANEDELGTCLDGGYDVNGDGIPDVIAGAPRSDVGGSSAGYGIVLSGVDGSQIWRKDGIAGNGRVGLAVCLMGDLNPAVDLRADFAIGSMNVGVKVYSGATGLQLYALNGLASTDLYGSALARLSDVTGDGIPELIVGASQNNFLFPGTGYVEVRNGATGALVYRKLGPSVGSGFGARVASVGDYNADGFDDFMVSSIAQDTVTPISVQIFSGPSGTLLATISGPHSERLGESIAPVGDTDGDGKVEFLLGASFASPSGLHSGKAVLYESPNQVQTGCVGGSSLSCTSLPNSTGQVSTLALVGSTSVAANNVVLVANKLPINQPGVFYYGNGTMNTPFGNGIRCVGGNSTTRLGAMSTGPIGLAATGLNLNGIQDPNVAIHGDSTWYFQFWYRDPNGGGVNFSNALKVDFCE